MAEWYHSGIEGYCKAASALAGMEGSGGWSAFGSDLFPNRFTRADKATKTWTLSRYRRGTGNRLVAFEGEWVPDSSEEISIAGREESAVNTCVDAMIESVSGEPEQESPLAALLFVGPNYDFANGFSEAVLPAIARGFQSEGYHSADITRFLRNIEELLGELRPEDRTAFREFARILVAALVYGPDDALVVSETIQIDTWHVKSRGALWDPGSDGKVVEVSQAYSFDCSFTGYSESFDGGSAVFFGRSAIIGDYLNALNRLEDELGVELRDDVAKREQVIFPIARTHRLVSNAHGLLLCQGSSWYFFDFSSNGTSIVNGSHEDARFVQKSGAIVNPGDRICLGLTQIGVDDTTQFQQAATVVVSFRVNE